ncbi:hypothetical protein QOZ80_5AG0361290 [Eleusine coracana subsp. coracana]|nr:hypothetical protein QOZ80_5AG0361290 [Eleusine coracana subsp. coracana]
MAPLEEPGDNSDRLKRALETHSIETVRFLVLAKEELGDSAYNDLIKTVLEIVKQSANPDGGITIEKCQEILSQVFVGKSRLLNSFHHFLQKRDPFHDDLPLDPVSFLVKIKASPHISDEDYNDLLTTLCLFRIKRSMAVEDVYDKAKKVMRRCPEFLEIFQKFLPPRLRGPLPIEQPCGSPKPCPMGKAVLSFTPDANYNLDGIRMKATNMNYNVAKLEHPRNQNHDEIGYPLGMKHSQQIPDSTRIFTNEGNGESLLAEEYEGDKIDPLPDWSPSRENELPPKVDLIASGTEDCFKFRTKNQDEENIIKCEDDMFESDIMLQRFRATADFIGNLQDHVDNDMKIQEHLTPLHRRCIEQLYDDYGLDLSLDYSGTSFKQLDAKGMTPKALLSEAKEINMERSITGVKNLSSSCNSQYHLVSDDAHHSIDLHIHKDIENIVSHASHKKISSEHKPVMIWTRLVQAFVSANCQLPELNCTIAPEEACERCGLSKKFLRSILNALLANNFPLSSKTGECLGHTSNNSNSIHDGSKMEIEDGEFVPCIENIQMDTMLGPVNGGASYDVAASSGDGSSFHRPESSIRDNDNKAEVQHGSREGPDVEMGSLAYSKTVTELCDLKGAKTCCSMVVLCRLHQMLYERLLVAKVLSREASAKAPSRGLRTCDLYAKFKGKLFKLLNGSTDNSKFEEYCLRILGPRSYVLFTLDKLICQVINQLRGVCDDGNLLIQLHDKMRRPNLSKDLLNHQNAGSSSTHPSNGLAQQNLEEGDEGSKLHGDTIKPTQNHFHRRKKRRLENSPASLSQPSVDNSNS